MLKRQLFWGTAAIALAILSAGLPAAKSLAQFPEFNSEPVTPILIPGLSSDSTEETPNSTTTSPKQIVDEVWQIVNKQYLDPSFNGQNWPAIRQQYLQRSYQSPEEAYQAIREMLAPLGDPLTRFITPDELQAMTEGSSNTVGVGLQLAQNLDTKALVIVGVIEKTPAAIAGILPQDVLVEINGESTQGWDVDAAVSQLRGPAGEPITIKVQRQSQKIGFNLIRIPVEISPVQYQVKTVATQKIGYIRLTQFSASATADMKAAIADLESQQVAGYILDLRNNEGGLFFPSFEIAKLWLQRGTITSTLNRDGTQEREEANQQALTNQPLVVLVDGGTASASEILAAALQENQRAVLIGSQTFGNSQIQSVRALEDGSALATTIAKWYTPTGKDIHEVGLKPDILVNSPQTPFQTLLETNAIATPEDPQYTKALEILTQKITASRSK